MRFRLHKKVNNLQFYSLDSCSEIQARGMGGKGEAPRGTWRKGRDYSKNKSPLGEDFPDSHGIVYAARALAEHQHLGKK